jgi:hypothetical protein
MSAILMNGFSHLVVLYVPLTLTGSSFGAVVTRYSQHLLMGDSMFMSNKISGPINNC